MPPPPPLAAGPRWRDLRARLARDEGKVGSLLAAGAFGDAERELDRICGYLAEDADPGLRERQAQLAAQHGRIRRLAAYDAAARQVFPLAGQEDFEQARLACHAALTALDVLGGAAWWDGLPVEDLSGAQAAALRQDIYRLLLLGSALGWCRASAACSGAAPRRRARVAARRWGACWAWCRAPCWRRPCGGAGWGRSACQGGGTTRTRGRPSRGASWRCARAGRAEAAQGSPPSRTGALVSGIATLLSDLADGPAGAPVGYGAWLAVRREAAEPVNAADHFFIALFNYFIAKRGGSGGVARFLALVQDGFPDLDTRAPLRTAERLLRAAAALEPRNFWPHWLLGCALLEAGAAEAAELAFNAAVAVDPAYARGYEQRALALAAQWRRGRDPRLRNRARADLHRAGQLAHGDPSVFWPRGELLDGWAPWRTPSIPIPCGWSMRRTCWARYRAGRASRACSGWRPGWLRPGGMPACARMRWPCWPWSTGPGATTGPRSMAPRPPCGPSPATAMAWLHSAPPCAASASRAAPWRRRSTPRRRGPSLRPADQGAGAGRPGRSRRRRSLDGAAGRRGQCGRRDGGGPAAVDAGPRPPPPGQPGQPGHGPC